MPAGDLLGWHSSAGPDVGNRDGHVFVDNLIAGDANFAKPLLFIWLPHSL